MTILLAVALEFNLPAALQRAIPDYTGNLQKSAVDDEQLRDKLNLGGLVNHQNRELANCTDGAPVLESCGTAPDVTGISGWLNTPNNSPVDLKSLRGKVVLVDFWAYSCINCQRAIPHVVDWYRTYKDAGLEVIGVHTPEYAFERVPADVASGAEDLGINYPVALDPSYSTWTNYRNRYWPAKYLIDADGIVRHIKFGEGDYDNTENLVRQLLSDVHPGTELPAPTEDVDSTPNQRADPETYLGVGKVVNHGGVGTYDESDAMFGYPDRLADDTFAYRGAWTLDYQCATAGGPESGIELNYRARNVYLVVGGTGTVTVLRGGTSRRFPSADHPRCVRSSPTARRGAD